MKTTVLRFGRISRILVGYCRSSFGDWRISEHTISSVVYIYIDKKIKIKAIVVVVAGIMYYYVVM
jgi:hypothetical protein